MFLSLEIVRDANARFGNLLKLLRVRACADVVKMHKENIPEDEKSRRFISLKATVWQVVKCNL